MRWYVFFEPFQVKTPFSPYSKGFIFQSFWGQTRKKSPEMFGDETWTQGSYTMAMVVRDCCPEVRRDLSMCGYLYPCAKYISHPFVVCVRGGGMRSGWWYALPRSMRSESGEPYKIQTNPISFLFWVLGTGKVEPLSCSPHVYRRDFAPSQ